MGDQIADAKIGLLERVTNVWTSAMRARDAERRERAA